MDKEKIIVLKYSDYLSRTMCFRKVLNENFFRIILTLKAPITTAADDIHKYVFIVFQRK